jgi:DNA-binding YbaB/EbfC family protein
VNINPFDLLKNAQKIQEQMGSFQEKLEAVRVTGSAGGGMAEIDMNGKMEVLAVRIAPEAMEDGDRVMLQDLIAAAFANAMEKVKEAISREVGGMIPGGMQALQGFPGMPGFPA